MKPLLKLVKTIYEQQIKNLLLARPFEKGQAGKKKFTQTAHTICSRTLQIFIFLIFMSATARGQLPINPDGSFEEATLGEKYADEIPGWGVYCWDATGTFEVVDYPVKEGDRALRIEVTELGELSFSIQAINFPFSVEPNTGYTYSVWAKANKEGPVVSFLVEDSVYNEWKMEGSVPMTTEWQFITFRFTTPDGATSGRAPIRFSESANDDYLPVTFYIDDLQIVESLPNDVGVLSLNLPSVLQLGQSLPIDITIKNFGTQTQSNFPVSYSIDGGTPITENFTGSLLADSSTSFIFAEQWDPQAADVYHLHAWTDLTNDEDQSNDTADKEVIVATHNAEDIKLYLDGDPSDAKLTPSAPEGYIYEQTVSNGSVTITYGDYFLMDDISGNDYTLSLQCASTSTRDYTAVVKIGNQEVIDTAFSVSGAQYKFYNISCVGIDPDITGMEEVELLVTVNGEGGVTSGMKWGNLIYSYITIPYQASSIPIDEDWSLPNYPNPFSSSTIIPYRLKTKGDVKLTIYDLTGRELKTLINTQQNAGKHSVSFDATCFKSGIYFYKLKAGSFEQSRKMILLR
jgi:hypothetical protein